ncbi:MAG: hypothetical protein JWR01_32 [Subtercola sp.]|nr:hypothetical protein [Subtercola sp.]
MSDFVTTVHGDRVAYDRYQPSIGSSEGSPVVVFVAGAGPYREIDPITAPTAEALAREGITSVVYDRIGRGESTASGTGPLTLEREIAALGALIEASGGGSAVLSGHSSGCSIALAAASAGLSVAGLVLWEAPLGGITGGTKAWFDEIARRVASGDLEGALVHYMKDMPPEWLEGARHSPMFPGMVARVGSQLPDAESLAWADSAPLADLVGSLTIPVLALYGEQTQPLMVEAAETIASSIPRAAARRLPGANHAWEPSAMASELVAFVTTRASGS